MKNLRLGVALMFLVIGCGEGGSQPATVLTSLAPPQNIDATSCYDIITDSSISAACSACCAQQGFPAATQYGEHCVCGDRRDDAGDGACADHAQSTSTCQACCTGAGFRGASWSSSSDTA